MQNVMTRVKNAFTPAFTRASHRGA